MAIARTTLIKQVIGNRRWHFGQATWANGDTSGTILTELYRVEAFYFPKLVDFTATLGSVAIVNLDPGATAGTVCWLAIGF